MATMATMLDDPGVLVLAVLLGLGVVRALSSRIALGLARQMARLAKDIREDRQFTAADDAWVQFGARDAMSRDLAWMAILFPLLVVLSVREALRRLRGLPMSPSDVQGEDVRQRTGVEVRETPLWRDTRRETYLALSQRVALARNPFASLIVLVSIVPVLLATGWRQNPAVLTLDLANRLRRGKVRLL